MGRQSTLHAGCGASEVIGSRFLLLTARIWAARFGGFRNPLCLCARVTAEHITKTARAPLVRQSVGCSSIRPKCKMAWSAFRQASCPPLESRAQPCLERNRHALDLADRRMVRPVLAARG